MCANAEAPGVPLDDVEEVSNYVAALQHGLRRMRAGFPLSLRLIREIHKVLLSSGRGCRAQPGEFRRSQKPGGQIAHHVHAVYRRSVERACPLSEPLLPPHGKKFRRKKLRWASGE
jgi:Fic family protein